MVWTCKVFCREQLGAARISSSALVTAGVTGEKTGNTGSFYPFSSSSKQHAPESMISEITNSGESQPSSQARLGSGIRNHVLAHQPRCNQLQSSLKPWANVLDTRKNPNTNTQQAKTPQPVVCLCGCDMQCRHPWQLESSSQLNLWERCCWGAWILLC